MSFKLPVYHGSDKGSKEFVKKIRWAREQFGGDFVDGWELREDGHYWIVGNFRNEADLMLFKLKFGL